MNEWAKLLIKERYNGKVPKTKAGKLEVELVSKVGSVLIVHFPEHKTLNGIAPSEVKEFRISPDKDDYSKGLMSVRSLASNMTLWISRGYKMETR